LQAILARISANYVPEHGDQFVLTGPGKQHDAPLYGLFAEGRGVSTIMFWLTCFMALFMVYALNAWLVKLMASAGYSLGSALSFALVLNIGATVGAIGGGWLADRLHIKPVLVVMFLLAAVSIGLLGMGMPTWALFVLVGLAGACTIGTQTLSCAYCGQFYPVDCRGTGLGLMLGAGRVGAILAPILIGAIIGMSLPLAHNFLAISVPAVIAAMTIAMVDHGRSNLARQGGPEAL
jgi:AAHS family benzoate transporter-like MFS transporter